MTDVKLYKMNFYVLILMELKAVKHLPTWHSCYWQYPIGIDKNICVIVPVMVVWLNAPLSSS